MLNLHKKIWLKGNSTFFNRKHFNYLGTQLHTYSLSTYLTG